MNTRASSHYVLVEDCSQTRVAWELLIEKEESLIVTTFCSAREIISRLDEVDCDSLIFVDENLKDKIMGISLCRLLKDAGFRNVYLYTAYDIDHFPRAELIRSCHGISGKGFPWLDDGERSLVLCSDLEGNEVDESEKNLIEKNSSKEQSFFRENLENWIHDLDTLYMGIKSLSHYKAIDAMVNGAQKEEVLGEVLRVLKSTTDQMKKSRNVTNSHRANFNIGEGT